MSQPELKGNELAYVQDAIAKKEIGPRGFYIDAFETELASYIGVKHALAVSSGTAAIQLGLQVLGVSKGDLVLCSTFTFAASAFPITYLGAEPVFVDAEINTGNIDIEAIESAINSRTKAIAVVHYLGVPVDMPKVISIAKKHNLFLLEDCALAPGAKVDGTHVGLHGDVGVFSFYPVKHITTAEGGMIILRDGELAKK